MAKAGAGNVVVAVDGTTGCQGALRYAVEQAVERDCGLSLVHVLPRLSAQALALPNVPQQVEAAGTAILAEAAALLAELAPDLKTSTDLRTGSRISELLKAATAEQLLVVGRETYTGIDRLVFGATTAAVVARSDVPTAVVPSDWESLPTQKRVVVGIRTDEGSEGLFETAFEYAVANDATIEVVHAWAIPDPYIDRIESRDNLGGWVEAGTKMAEQALQPWRARYPDVAVSVRILHDQPIHALLESAKGAAVMFLLRRAAPRFLGAHLGRTARYVIGEAPCPVHVLPHPST
ncbi:universal stress protein [Ornithinimicrobium sp. Arc0846-15]|uniref:universal stress protein n=1 Tax=Ornithinimicrobium sp. INDO-MA30-4 TaxID=2908651 RepID=UPI001C675D28|nr:universal stress protein [Ornithinimicrobium sp. INDO-MA30-4]MBW8172316.1 universal stress protein [Ornithinimicrobium laminariae]UJH69370.1 universal stress protein [Ornithinimicrobium sp. INDO-MA30-4]